MATTLRYLGADGGAVYSTVSQAGYVYLAPRVVVTGLYYCAALFSGQTAPFNFLSLGSTSSGDMFAGLEVSSGDVRLWVPRGTGELAGNQSDYVSGTILGEGIKFRLSPLYAEASGKHTQGSMIVPKSSTAPGSLTVSFSSEALASTTNFPSGYYPGFIVSTDCSENGGWMNLGNWNWSDAHLVQGTSYTVSVTSTSTSTSEVPAVLIIPVAYKGTTITITYDANGGSGAPSATSGVAGAGTTLSSTTPTLAYHTFKGWSASPTATSASYAAGSTQTFGSSVTLYAVWTANTYTKTGTFSLVYNGNGATSGSAPATETQTARTTATGAAAATPSYAFTVKGNTGSLKKTGYEFLGWSTSSAATSATYVAGSAVTLSGEGAVSRTLYAVWKRSYRTLTVSVAEPASGSGGVSGTLGFGTVTAAGSSVTAFPEQASYDYGSSVAVSAAVANSKVSTGVCLKVGTGSWSAAAPTASATLDMSSDQSVAVWFKARTASVKFGLYSSGATSVASSSGKATYSASYRGLDGTSNSLASDATSVTTLSKSAYGQVASVAATASAGYHLGSSWYAKLATIGSDGTVSSDAAWLEVTGTPLSAVPLFLVDYDSSSKSLTASADGAYVVTEVGFTVAPDSHTLNFSVPRPSGYWKTPEVTVTAGGAAVALAQRSDGSYAGSASFDYGTKVAVAVSAKTGWNVTQVADSGGASMSATGGTLTMGTSDRTVTVTAAGLGVTFVNGGLVVASGSDGGGVDCSVRMIGSPAPLGTCATYVATMQSSYTKPKEWQVRFGSSGSYRARAETDGTVTSGKDPSTGLATSTFAFRAQTYGSAHYARLVVEGDASADVTVTAKTYVRGSDGTDAESSAGGAVSGAGTAKWGSDVTLTATPADGYDFVCWTGGASGTGSTATLTVKSDVTVGAVFQKKGYDVTATGANALVKVDGSSSADYAASAVSRVEHGGSVTFVAVAKSGYENPTWSLTSGAGSVTTIGFEGSPEKISVTGVKGAATVTATATEILYKVDATAGANGSVAKSPDRDGYSVGTSVTLTATPVAGYVFSGWSDGVASRVRTLSVPAKDTSLTASFARKRMKVTAAAGTGGSATADGGSSSTVDYGSAVKLVATPDEHYTFSGWTSSAGATESGSSFSVTASDAAADEQTAEEGMTEDSSVTWTASFVPTQYEVKVVAVRLGGKDVGTASGGGKSAYGGVLVLTAAPADDTRHEVLKWTTDPDGEDKVADGVGTYNVTVAGDATYYVWFAAKKYSLTISAENGTTVPAAGTYKKEPDEAYSVTATAAEHYVFRKRWTVATGGETATVEAETLAGTMPAADVEVSPEFALETHKVSVAASDGGSAVVGYGGKTGTEFTLSYGTTGLSLSATADDGYAFSGWYLDGVRVEAWGLRTVVTGVTVSGDAAYEARFEKSAYAVTVSVVAPEGSSGCRVTGLGGDGVTSTATFDVVSGASATLKATPGAHCAFVRWDDGTTEAEREIGPFGSDMDVTATFSYVTVTVKAQSNDEALGTVYPAEESGQWTDEKVVLLTATPAAKATFDGWYSDAGHGRLVSSSRTVLVSRDYSGADPVVTYYAKFSKAKAKVTATAVGFGAVSGGGEYEYDSTAVLKASPSSGYELSEWRRDGVLFSRSATCSFVVDGPASFVATFVKSESTRGRVFAARHAMLMK